MNKQNITKSNAKRADKMIHPLPPRRSDIVTVDRRSEFLGISTLEPPTSEIQRAFVASKAKLLRTQPTLHPGDRQAVLSKFMALTPSLGAEDIGPVPGGVGYGVFYNSAFKTSFATGTAISWEIVCPTTPGGNVSTWLYVTATNRSGKGVEAFVAYEGQNPFSFNIYDWARPEQERWRPATPFGNLGAYLGTESAHGSPCQVIAVINTTYQQSPGNWANEVRLLDVLANQWHLVYQYLYQASLQDQTSGWVGSWAPIVETFQDAYSGTSLMGALNTQVLARDAAGNWGQWNQLASMQSDLRTDNKGLALAFLDQNYAWAVTS